ncbi:MAG: magnesium transporter CorA family protein [Thiobacillus sp.]|uniref:magnesium transporter CorA family protein n=1 Tax=Thiobacillus sp. TaxID=924 RepID=UPI002894DC7F|nr:magnesium transporter CorA family protein [Thiobacillus sp.]MDT3707313.1 magnesium transporter CorA family protein [Thiobacillus sp.]
MLRAYSTRSDLLVEVASPPAAATGIVWVDLLNPTADENASVESLLGISIPSQDEMQEIELSARLYQEDGATFMTMTALANLDGEAPVKTPVTFILKGATLATVRWSDPRPFLAYQTRAARQKEALSSTGEQVMLGILEALTDRTADALEKLGNDIDAVSREVFRNAGNKTRDLQSVIALIGQKAELLIMIQESLVSLGRVAAYHAALDPAPRKGGAGKESRSMLRIIQRDAQALGEHSKALTGRVTFLLEATLGMINLEQNQIIKIVSVAAVVFLPPTLVASIYGMNFGLMPELAWSWGYPMALGLMILSAVLPYLFFKRKGWL